MPRRALAYRAKVRHTYPNWIAQVEFSEALKQGGVYPDKVGYISFEGKYLPPVPTNLFMGFGQLHLYVRLCWKRPVQLMLICAAWDVTIVSVVWPKQTFRGRSCQFSSSSLVAYWYWTELSHTTICKRGTNNYQLLFAVHVHLVLLTGRIWSTFRTLSLWRMFSQNYSVFVAFSQLT